MPDAPKLRFAGFVAQLPTGRQLHSGEMVETVEFEIDPTKVPGSDDAVDLFLLVAFDRGYGKHHVECALVDPQGKTLSSSRNESIQKNEPWASVFPIGFLPLGPGDYLFRVFLDDAPLCERTISVSFVGGHGHREH